MSPANHENNPRPDTVYTLSSGVHQGNVNQGFHPDHLQTPPPKYEDVISGDYLKWRDTNYLPPPRWTDQPTDVTCHCTNSQTNTARASPSAESVTSCEDTQKKCRVHFAWVSFVLFILTVFIWRIYAGMGF